MRNPLLRGLAVLAVILSSYNLAWAQLPTATLNGTVTDPAGAVLPGAKVTLTSQATGAGRETATSDDGRYVFANLAAGLYNVRVEASGFAPKEHKDVRLEVGRATTLDVSLEVAPVGQVVTVEGGAAAIELTQSQVQGQITASIVENIPLNGRNFLELAFLLPGNRPATNYDPTKTNTLEVSSAGAFGRGGNLTVDGGDNNDEVVGGTLMNFPQDGIQEFQIVTNRFTAEVGRSGSSIINIVTKSGSNRYHGSAFFFFRHKELQTLPATLSREVVARKGDPPFDREQIGGSIGGPIKRDRAFWFFSIENRNQDNTFEVVERDFVAQEVVNTFTPGFLDDVMLTSRVDFRATDRDHLSGRYSFNRNKELAAASLRRPIGTAAQGQVSLNRFNSVVVDWTRTISPNKVNSLLFHVDTFINKIPGFPSLPETNPPGLAAGDGTRGNDVRFPSFEDGSTWRAPQRTRMNRYQIRDVFSWTRGRHNLRFGGEWQNAGTDVLFDLFGTRTIFLAEDFPTADRNGDGVIDDRDIRVVLTISNDAPVRPPTAPFLRNTYLGFFIQDDWKALPNLTLNLGLRWEFDNNILSRGELHEPCPDPAVLTTTAGCIWLRNALGEHSASRFKNFGPRFGFAWDPFSRGQTVIRGGYGIYYDRVVLEVPVLEVLLDGRVIRLDVTGGLATGENILLEDPFAGGPVPAGIGVTIVDNNARHPLVQQFSLGVEQQFGSDWVVSADGVHNFGQRLLIGRFLRQGTSLDPNISLTCNGVDPCTVVDPATGIGDNITNIEPSAKSWYSGLLASLRKRPSGSGDWRWGFNISYTLSKALNFANDDQIPFNGAEDQANLALRSNNLRLEKGYSPADERHRFVFFGVFGLPYDFTISPILTVASSVPMDSFVPALNSRLPIIPRNALGRDIKNGAELNAAITTYNGLPACTSTFPRPFPCNNLGGAVLGLVDPNLQFGDSFSSLDIRVTKAFTFAERHRVELIAEGFNLFNITNIRGINNTNYSGFNNDITSANFNKPVRTAGGFFGAGGPRAFQFAFRYSF